MSLENYLQDYPTELIVKSIADLDKRIKEQKPYENIWLEETKTKLENELERRNDKNIISG